MVARAATEVFEKTGLTSRPILTVKAFVVDGREIAKKTLNPRLGILDGLSILGTTGIVKPYSHAAYRATIAASLRVAEAAGLELVVLSTGRSSEKLARRRLNGPIQGYVLMGDYLGFSLRQARQRGFKRVIVAAFFAKAWKMALGAGQTRFDAAPLRLGPLGSLTRELTGDDDLAEEVARANTARQALTLLQAKEAGLVWRTVGERAHQTCRRLCRQGVTVGYLLFDPDGRILYEALT
jgi:cobalt-precorrin-5B (C1)-methyltransferase